MGENELDRLYREARNEGRGLTVWAGGDARSQTAMYTDAFRKQFPDVPIEVVVDLSKYHDVLLEYRLLRGEPVPDVIHLQSLQDYTKWKERGLLERFRPAGLEHTPQQFVDPDGFYTPMFVFAFTNVHDSRVVADGDAPREAEDYLDPRWRDRIALTYPHDDDAILYQFEQIIDQHGWSWFEDLLDQNIRWVRGTATPLSLLRNGESAVTFTSYGALVDRPEDPLRLRLPERTFFQSWYQTGAIPRAAANKAAARLYLSFWLSAAQQAETFMWPAREDTPLPEGLRHVRWYPNTSPWGFREFMHDRDRVERLKGIFENFIGPVQGPNPNSLDL
jgi:ABC-type Fe3+ transport system substrate-binding protein